MNFEQYSYLIDIDGTVLHNEQAINYSVEFIEKLQNSNTAFMLASNSILPKHKQQSRLLKVGITVNEDQLYSPIDAINIYLQQRNIQSCFCVASLDDMTQIACPQNDIDPQIIILLDFEKNKADYDCIQNIIDLSQNDTNKIIPIITASRSPFYLSGNTKKVDTGAFVCLIESIIQKEIEVFGKPSGFYFDNAMSKLNSHELIKPTIIIGDDYQTDIIKSKEFGLKTALIKSGKYKTGQESLCDPDYVIADFRELMDDF